MTQAYEPQAPTTPDLGISRRIDNAGLFFKRWLANPLQMGSIVPSSPALCRRIAAHTTYGPDEAVIEIGAGTGVVSKALLDAGLPPSRLFVVEIVADMAKHLRQTLPGTQVIHGDARDLPALIPAEMHGRIGTVVCGIPMVLLPLVEQRRILAAVDQVAPGRGVVLFTYCITSPLPCEKLGLIGERVAFTPLNFPPASVWRYTPKK